MRAVKKLGSWRPELPDHRDRIFRPSGRALAQVVEPLGKTEGVRVEDQRATSSCTGHAGTTALEISLGLHGADQQLSRLYAYYKAREMIGEQKFDDGAYCRDIFKGFAKYGCPLETKWPFLQAKVTTAPGAAANKNAALQLAGPLAGIVYESCSTLDQILGAINDGYPVMFGFTAYEAIFGLNATNYMLPMPGPRDAPVGGHAICADGYDMSRSGLWIENSWGTRWGLKGRFMMPFDYITNPQQLADDFWIVRKP